MHQHKDKVVYEQTILINSPQIENVDGKLYISFDLPVTSLYKDGFILRWVESNRLTRITKRSLRLIDSNGTILYQLSKKPLKTRFVLNDTHCNFWYIHCFFKVDKDEAMNLAKIFFIK